ncbi:MucR family transcriptional regulator [Desulfovibrio sp. OttesenSCG-928-C06]|nr:MucR family transcriptional regulator [Desulfovibrio sp. OttesenSCG-928-C06]
MEPYINSAIEIVKAQAAIRSMTEEEMSSMIHTLAQSINRVMPESPVYEEDAPRKKLRGKLPGEKSITCNECGKNFRLLTRKHLLSHGMSEAEYKEKWGYPKNMSLVCKALQKERRKNMNSIKLWEKRRKHSEE